MADKDSIADVRRNLPRLVREAEITERAVEFDAAR